MKQILHRLIHFISHFQKSISTKVVLIILVLVLPLNILAIVLSNTAVDSMTQQARISVSNVVENYITELQNRMENTGYLLWNMKSEETNGTILMRQEGDDAYQSARIKFYHKFNNNMLLANGADGYFFYMPKLEDVLVWDNTVKNKIDGREFVEGAVAEGIESGWQVYTVEDRPVWCMFIRNNNVIYGGWIYLDTLAAQLRKDIQYEDVKSYFQETRAAAEEEDQIIVSVPGKKEKIWLNAVLSRSEIVGGISSIYSVMQVIAFAALILIPVLYIGISRLLLAPLRTVNNAQKKLREGDLAYRIRQKSNSLEYQYSFQSFNKMADQIQTLKIENYEKELDRQKMEFKNLQLQIHPHFLLNTFNLVYTLTQRNDADAAQDVILYLSDYFRYIFRSGKNLELFPKEQKLIEGYIGIIRMRYQDGVKIEYEYDPELSFVRIPPLLLHNFVENVIKHALQKGQTVHILILGQYADKRVTFVVTDDGPGMTREQVKKINERMRKKDIDGEHIGFSNSLKRLQYFFGDTAEITVSSDVGLGTVVTIGFPYDLELCDESFDGE